MTDPRDLRQFQEALNTLLTQVERADYGRFAIEVKVHAGRVKQIDVQSSESYRIDEKPRREG